LIQAPALLAVLQPTKIVGDFAVIVTATDGLFSVADTFNLEVVNVNDAPVISGAYTATISENTSIDTVLWTIAFTDADLIHGDTHTWSITGW
jgi:hypothetical protein